MPALEQVGQWLPVLTQRLQQRAGTLSGGEQKMLIVRARADGAAPESLMWTRSPKCAALRSIACSLCWRRPPRDRNAMM